MPSAVEVSPTWKGYRRRGSGGAGDTRLPEAFAGQSVLGQQGQSVPLVEKGHSDIGIELGEAPDLAVLLRHQALVQRGHLDEQARLGEPEIRSEPRGRSTVLIPLQREPTGSYSHSTP